MKPTEDAPRKPRGRPRAFVVDQALDQIIDLFRTRGYDGTSLEMIADATRLSRPSLYAAFGSKENMYLKAMDKFAADAARAAGPRLHSGASVEESLLRFFRAMINIYTDANHNGRGCLVYATAPGAASHQQIQQKLAQSVDQLNAEFRVRFNKLEPQAGADVIESMVSLAAATLMYLSTKAAAGSSRRELNRIALHAAKAIQNSAAGPHRQRL